MILLTGVDVGAQEIIQSKLNAAGFRYSVNSAVPVIDYQQNIHMLSAVNDRPSVKVYGNGRVVVHYPVYMKKSGDYEMQLSKKELVAMIRSMSNEGLMDFDEKKAKASCRLVANNAKAKGQYSAVSDVLETVVDIKLDEYQKNVLSKKITGFSKRFKWDNLEQDVVRFNNVRELVQVNRFVSYLNDMMSDTRLVKKVPR
ncbi:MAG TPA: hypothetical protein ENJ87_13465 [Gammaproteobacteria bacterium]|nr:hypothetical protein [Gammaproteobacteria bacterium]